MTFKLACTFASALALAACNGSPATNMTSDVGNAAGATLDKAQDGVGAVVGAATAPMANSANAYVTNAAIGDMYEIESSKLALKKSSSAAVKKFAQQMITDHTATTAKLKATIKQAGLTLTPATELDARRAGMLDNLRSASAADFDKVFLDQQTAAHQEALTLHSDFAEDGDNDALKKLAGETTPKIQHHFDMVKQLDKSGADAAH
jgi:putative membrane protein